MYIADFHPFPRVIRVYDVIDDGTKLANGKEFVTCTLTERPDGFRRRHRRQLVVRLEFGAPAGTHRWTRTA